MKSIKLLDAVGQIDERFIEGYLNRRAQRQQCNSNEKTRSSIKPIIFRRAILIAFTVILAIATVLPGIIVFISKQPNNQSIFVDQTLRIGFDLENDKKINGVKLAVTTEKTKIKVGEDLPISLYCVCGSKEDYIQNGNVPQSVTASVLMSYSGVEPDKIVETVRKIEDATMSDYTWNGSFEGIKTELVIVPAQTFIKSDDSDKLPNKSDGVLVLALEVHKEYSNGIGNTDRDSVALYYQIKGDEIYLNPSRETLELVGTVIQKLALKDVFMFGIDPSPVTLSDVYEHTAKWVAPELLTLETKKDASIALVKLYEDILTEYRLCNLDLFYGVRYAASQSQEEGHELLLEFDEEYLKIVSIQKKRMTIEALLALDYFVELLDEQMTKQILADFEEFATITYDAERKFYDDARREVLFEKYRNMKENG